MPLKQPEEEVKMGAPEWVVTFGDMMSLLLTFFVLLLSFSSLEVVKFKKFAGHLREAFGLRSEIRASDSSFGSSLFPNAGAASEPRPNPVMPTQIARSLIEKSETSGKASVHIDARGVILRVDGDAVFGSGSADLNSEALPLLDEIAAQLNAEPGNVEIEGHTDDVPISNSKYPSNWELSAARAGTAARYLVSKGVPAPRIKAAGFADSRPVAPNDSAENRARNRRVEFLFVHKPE